MSKSVVSGAMADPLAALMEAAQQGDRAAYEQLLRQVLPRLRARMRHVLGDPDEAEDAVQETLLAMHRARHSFDPKRPFMPWLVTVANRRALDRLSRRGRDRRLHAPLPEGFDPPDHTPLPEHRFGAVAVRQLHQAVAKLPAGQAQAVRLIKFADAPLAEVSARTGISVTALKVATHRAVASLRRIMDSVESGA